MRHFSRQSSPALVFVLLAAAGLTACGGTSGSETVSGNQTTNQNGTAPLTPPPPAPSSPSTPEAPPSGSNNNPPTNDPPAGNANYNLGNTPQTVIDQCMSVADKEILTQVNDARSQVRSCGNQTYQATSTLSWHCTLENVAMGHNRDMGDHNFFSHTGSDGLRPADRVTNAGYNWSAVGENIAAGQRSISAVMTVWLDSPGHCANIMNPGYSEIGAASYTVTGSDYPVYWTQNFAKP